MPLLPILKMALETAIIATATSSMTNPADLGAAVSTEATTTSAATSTSTASATASSAVAATTLQGASNTNERKIDDSSTCGTSKRASAAVHRSSKPSIRGSSGGGDEGSQRRYGRRFGHGSVLWDLLRLHHLALATEANVARYKACIRVVRGMGAHEQDINGDGDDDDDDDDSEDDYDDGDGGTSGNCDDAANGAKIGDLGDSMDEEGKGGGDGDRGRGLQPPMLLSPPSKSRKRPIKKTALWQTQEELEAEEQVQRMEIRRLEAEAEKISAAASAARTRLVLMMAWETLSAPVDKREQHEGAISTPPDGFPAAGVERVELRGPGNGSSDGSGSRGDGTTRAATGVTVSAAREAAARCLRDSCRLARFRAEREEHRHQQQQQEHEQHRRNGGEASKGDDETAGDVVELPPMLSDRGRFLAGPLAIPPLDLPCKKDVVKALFLEERGGGDGGGERLPAVAGKPSLSEVCLFCGGPVLSGPAVDSEAGAPAVATVAAGTAGRSMQNGQAATVVGEGVEEEVGTRELSPELPGWTVCRLNHRLRRCMDTLAPTLAVAYRRCEVCRSLVEVSASSDTCGGVAVGGAGSASERERCTCFFCDVLLVSGGRIF